MRAALHRAAKTGNPDRGRDLHDGRRHARHAAPRLGAHASRWCVDELAEHAPRLPRLRAERRARRTPLGGGTRVGPSELYGYDAHGNIAFLTDGTGAETDTYTYDGWGNLVGRTGTTPNTRVFAGAEFDPDLGLVNLRARYYNPSTGRFLTIDALDAVTPALPADLVDLVDEGRESDSPYGRAVVELFGVSRPPHQHVKRYLYADGDPANRVDPSGLVDAVDDALITRAVAATLIAGFAITKAKDIGGAVGDLGHEVYCAEQNIVCIEQCTDFLGENGGTNFQAKYKKCWKDCMKDAGCL